MKFLLSLLLFLSGCATYKLPKPDRPMPAYDLKVSEEVVEAPVAETEVEGYAESEAAPSAAPVSHKSASASKRRASAGYGLSRARAERDGIGVGGLGTFGYGSGTGSGFGRGEALEETSPLAEVDRVLESLDLGNLAFNSPELMGVGEVYQVELLLSPVESESVLASAVSGDGPVETVSGIRVAPEMEASLIGSGFDIKAVTPARQAVSRLNKTRWAWDVSPKEKGKHNLHLTLSARIRVDGKDTPYVVRTFSKTIKVEVSFWGTVVAWLENNLEWVWTTLIVPLGLWLWGRWRKRKKLDSGEPPQVS